MLRVGDNNATTPKKPASTGQCWGDEGRMRRFAQRASWSRLESGRTHCHHRVNRPKHLAVRAQVSPIFCPFARGAGLGGRYPPGIPRRGAQPMAMGHPGSSSSPRSRWLRFGVAGAGVLAVVALTSWCAVAVLNDNDGTPSGPDGAQTATPPPSPTATATTAATASPTRTPAATASPTVATATTAPQTPTRAATATAVATSTTVPAQPTATPTSTTAPAQPTPTPTPTKAATPVRPTPTPTPAALPNRTVTYKFALREFASTLTLKFDFVAGMVTGTLSGSRIEVVTNTCYSGGQLLETAEATATSTFSSALSATIAPTGGSFSSPADITGTTTYAITRPFKHPSCLGGNQVPAPVPFGGFGSVSGDVPADGPLSFNVKTTVGNHSQ